jgi:tRNA(fMet)-specific endonuclease VapC
VSYLLDTDTCSAHLKQKGPVTNRFLQYTGRLHISVITWGELLTWARRAQAPPQRLQAVEDLAKDVTLLEIGEEIGEEIARRFGGLRAELLDIGRPTPEMDLWIAATALVHGLTVVTHNARDFAHIPGLPVEDWLAP